MRERGGESKEDLGGRKGDWRLKGKGRVRPDFLPGLREGMKGTRERGLWGNLGEKGE